ncbi:MAG: translocation/assembly module TamB [Muribaculaceae bacterium]|nr:translocation/assembly module TamB [Muribaculaceae bacterium]
MAKNKRGILSYLAQALGVLCIAVLLLPLSLYIPWVQNCAKDYACEWAAKETGLNVSIERILLKFPLDISVDSLLVLDQQRDTMVHAGNLTADIAVRPLLDLNVEVDEVCLTQGVYRMMTEDSSMFLVARLDMCRLKGADVDVDNQLVNLLDGNVKGGDVLLDYYPYKKENECDTTESKPWKVNAHHLVVEDIDYAMTMLPTIDHMMAHVDRVTLVDGEVDTGEHTVSARSFAVDTLDVNYIYPSARYAHDYDLKHPVPADTLCPLQDTVPWTVKVDSVRLSGVNAVYALTNAQLRPRRGLDTDYIAVRDLNANVTNLYNRATDVQLSLHSLTLEELGSGIALQRGEGDIALNSKLIKLEKVKLKTLLSDISLDARLDLSLVDNPNNGQVKFDTDSKIALQDVVRLMPAYAPMLTKIPPIDVISIKGNAQGNAHRADIGTLTVVLPKYARATVSGTITNPTDINNLEGDINVDARFDNINFIKPTLLDKALQRQVNFPPMSLTAHAKVKQLNVAAEGKMVLSTGQLVGKGTFNANSDKYTLDASFNNFPVKSIMPLADADNLTAHVVLSGQGFDFMNPKADVDAQVDLSSLYYNKQMFKNLNTRVSLHGGNFDGFIKSANDNCRVNLNVNGHMDGYSRYTFNARGTIDDLDLHALGLYKGECSGHGHIDAQGNMDLSRNVYNVTGNVDNLNWSLDGNNIKVNSLALGDAVIDLNRDYYNATFNVAGLDCVYDGDSYRADAIVGQANIDLKRKLYDATFNASGLDCMYAGDNFKIGHVDGQANIDVNSNLYDVTMDVSSMDCAYGGDNFVADLAQATFHANDTATVATFDNEDNHINFAADYGMDRLLEAFKKSGNIAMKQYKDKAVNIDTLQQALPPFALNMKMGTDGLVQRYMQKFNVDFREVSLDVKNDSTIFIDGYVHSLSYDGTNIDTLTLKATQWNKYLAFGAHMGNRPGTMDEFAQVNIRGGIRGATVDFLATQQNIHNEMGYRLGCNAMLTDTAVNMKFFPKEPVIGYRKWTVNEGNYFNFNYDTRMLDADLKLESDSSVIAVNTRRSPGASTEDVLVDISNLRVEEWTKFMPGIAPMTGVLNANMDVAFDGHAMDGKGVIDLKDFTYNGMREGDFTINTDYGLDPSTGGTRINADMLVDGSHVALAYGSLGEAAEALSGDALNLDMKLDRFPLSKVSPFIPGRMVWMKGYLEGDVKVSGSMDNPVLNGKMVADSAYVTLPRYGSSLKLCDDKLEINDNVLNFNNYRILGLNEKPITINGHVDIKDTSSPVIDLTLAGKNVQFIGAEQRTFSEVFGKAYADVSASVKSRNNYMNMRADVSLLSGSNITYVLQDEISNLTSNVDENMVTFVNFKDSVGGTPNLVTNNATTATNIMANLEVQQGAKINAFLSPDGKDRATIDGSGRFKYSLDFAGKDVFTGTYTIESGNFRYTPPLISQKNFTVTSGSTVTWTGDMLNPQLNISATEHVKTSVSTEGQGARPVDFMITANVGGTLGVIKLEFDMSAEGDMSVQNELQSMSEVQRSQAAINMLLYNTYSGTNSAGSVNNLTASAALFSFVQSQLNSWAAKTLKGVDLSFGINQYEAKSGKGIETSYSYRLSKNLFNDRFKIVVGGEYSTDATAEENFGQNLISDISFEYTLNSTGSRYVRLFRHTGYESILEGQVTKTGVGFVMKHKVNDLKSLFMRSWFKSNKNLNTTVPDTSATQNDAEPAVVPNTEK